MLSAPSVEVQSQVLREAVRLIGTPFSLYYRSDQVPGRRAAYSIKIPLSRAELPRRLKNIQLEVVVAGKNFAQDFPAEANQAYTFIWDGKGAGNRNLFSRQMAQINIGYVYESPFGLDRTRWRERSMAIGIWDARILGLGGWSLNIHHTYDDINQELFLGNGRRRSKVSGTKLASGNGAGGNGNKDEQMLPSENGNEIYIFDGNGLHLRTLHALTGAVLYQFNYDTPGRLTAVLDGYGNITKIERRPNGTPVAIIGPYGQRTELGLNADGYLASVTNPAGGIIRFTYANDGLLTAATDAMGNVYRFRYDDQGRLAHREEPDGGSSHLGRATTANGFQIAVLSALGRESDHLMEKLPDGTERRVNKCCGGSRLTTDIANDGTRTITYSDGTSAVVEQQSDPRLGTQTRLLKKSVLKTPGGLIATLSTNRKVTLANPNDPLSLTGLNDTVELNGHVQTTSFDALQKKIVSKSAAGRQNVTTLNEHGDIKGIELPGLHPIYLAYDDHGRITTVAQGSREESRLLKIAYDSQGKVAGILDPLNRVSRFQYNSAGLLSAQVLPDGREIHFEYDANGNQISITPPGRPAHLFKYNPVNQAQEYLPPKVENDGGGTSYAYNTEKQLTRLMRPDGAIVAYTYDEGGRPNAIAFPNGEVRFEYDPRTKYLTDITTSDGNKLSYIYDGSLVTGTAWSGMVNGYVTRTYDQDFRIASLSVNGDKLCDYEYDADGLLIRGGKLILHRDPRTGFVMGTELGNVITSQEYNGFGELTKYRATFKGEDIFVVDYTRDALGRITQKTETIRGQAHTTYTYGYDLVGRLTDVSKDGKPTAHYVYDSNGNRLAFHDPNGTVTGSYDDQDRLIQYGDAKYQHTANGEWLSKTINGQMTTYEYDAFGNLKTVTLSDSTKIQYIVDGNNRRVGKQVSGALVQGFLYQDGLRPIAELDVNGNVVSRFVYATHSNVPDYMFKGSNTFHIVTDHLGGPRLVVDIATGEIVQCIDYDEFGVMLTDTNPGFQPFGFAGGLYDRNTMLVRLGARDYDAFTGRWTAKDPIGFRGGLSLYSYVKGNPVNHIDPLGLADSITNPLNPLPGPVPQAAPTPTPDPNHPITPGKGLAFGISGDFSCINPFTSRGGGMFGGNIEWTTDSGWGGYFYYSEIGSTAGLSLGGSLQVNVASGNGDWAGPFVTGGGNLGPVSGSYFTSGPSGWTGVGVGPSVGAPVGVYSANIPYVRTW